MLGAAKQPEKVSEELEFVLSGGRSAYAWGQGSEWMVLSHSAC